MSDTLKSQRAVLSFFQGETRCGVYARYIQELMAVPLLTPVPGRDALRGLFLYKGCIVPVFSFAGLCEEAETAAEGICMVLREDGGEPIGITVAGVDQLFAEGAASLADMADVEYGSARMSSMPTPDGVILMLDVGRTYQALTR